METLNSGKKSVFFVPYDLKIWQMTLKDKRVPLLCYSKVYTLFDSHQWIWTGVTVRKCQIRVKIDFLSRVTLKFGRWPWKMIGHLFYATSSFLHHFVDICKFKLELQSRNAQFGSISRFFCAMWPWNLMDDLEKWYSISLMAHQASVHYFIVIC